MCFLTVNLLFCKLTRLTCAFFWHTMKTSYPEVINLCDDAKKKKKKSCWNVAFMVAVAQTGKPPFAD